MRRPVPGYRRFVCDECDHEWWEPTRDCRSPSGEFCPVEDCGAFAHPHGAEAHPEWSTDRSGNLVGTPWSHAP